MAKEKDVKKVAGTTEVTVDNVMEDIRKDNVQNDETVKKAFEELDKEQDEKKKNEAKAAIMKFKYKNRRALIAIRKERADEKIRKTYLTSTKEILDKFLAGEITMVEANKMEEEIESKLREGFKKNNEQYRTDCDELRHAFSGYYYSYEWDITNLLRIDR